MELNKLFNKLGIGRAAGNQGGTGHIVRTGSRPEDAFVTTSERFKQLIREAQTDAGSPAPVQPQQAKPKNMVPVTLVPNYKFETVGVDSDTGEETGELVVRNTGQKAEAEHAVRQPLYRIREFLYVDAEGDYQSMPTKLSREEAAAQGLRLSRRNETYTADRAKASQAQQGGFEVEEYKPRMRQTEPKIYPQGRLPEDKAFDWTRDEVLPINHGHEGGGVFRYQNNETGDLVPSLTGGGNYQFSELMTEQDPETGKYRRVNKPIETEAGEVNPHDLLDWGSGKPLRDMGDEMEGQHGITFEPSLKPFRLTGKQIVNAHGHKNQDFTPGNRLAYMLAKLADNNLYQPVVERGGKTHTFVPKGAKRFNSLPPEQQKQIHQKAAQLAGEAKRLRAIGATAKGEEKKQAADLVQKADRDYIDFIAENWPEKLREEVLSQPYVKHLPIHDKTGEAGVRFHMGDTHASTPKVHEGTGLYTEKGNEDTAKYADHNSFVLRQLVDAFRKGVQQSISKKSGTLNSARHVRREPVTLPDGTTVNRLAPTSQTGKDAVDFFGNYPYFHYAMQPEDRERVKQLQAAGLTPEEAAATHVADSPNFKRHEVKMSAEALRNPDLFSTEDITYTDDDGVAKNMRVYRAAPGVKAAQDIHNEVIERHNFSESDWGEAAKIAEQTGLDEDDILFSMFAGRVARKQKAKGDDLQLDSGLHPDQRLFEPDAQEVDRQRRFIAKFNEHVNDIYNEYGATLSRDDTFVDDQGKRIPSRLRLSDEQGGEKFVYLSQLTDRQLLNLEKRIGKKITRVPSDLKRIQMQANQLAISDPQAYSNFAGKSDEERIEAEVQKELKKTPEANADQVRKQVSKFFAQHGMTPSEQKRVSDFAFADARSRLIEQKMRAKSVDMLRKQQPNMSDQEAQEAVDDFARAKGGKTPAQVEMEKSIDGALDAHMDDLGRALLANAKKKAARVGREHGEWPNQDTLEEWVSNATLFSLVPQTKDLTITDLVRYNGEIKLNELPEAVKRQTANGTPYYSLMSVDDFVRNFPEFLGKFEAEAQAVQENNPELQEGSPEFNQKILEMVKDRTARRYGMKTIRQSLLSGAGMPADSPAWHATQTLLRGAEDLPPDQVKSLLMRAYGADSMKDVANLSSKIERAVGRNMNQLKDYGTPPQPDTPFGDLGREYYRNIGRGRDFEKGRLQLQNEGVSEDPDAFNPLEFTPDESMDKMFARAESTPVSVPGAYQEDAILPVSVQQKVARDSSIRYSGSDEGNQMADMAYGYADMLKAGFFDEDNPPPSRAQFAQFWKDRIAKQIDVSKQEANRIRKQIDKEKEQGAAGDDRQSLREMQRLEYILDRVLVPATRKGGSLMNIVGRMLAIGRQYSAGLKRMREKLMDYQKLRHDYDMALKEYEHVQKGGQAFSFQETAPGMAGQQLLEELKLTAQSVKDAELMLEPDTDKLVQLAKEFDRYAAEVENFAVKMLPVNIEGLILGNAKGQGERALRQELIQKFEAKASSSERMAKAKDSADNVIASSSLIELPAFEQQSFGELGINPSAIQNIRQGRVEQASAQDLSRYISRMAVLHVNNMAKWDAAVGKTYDEGENASSEQQTRADYEWFVRYWLDKNPDFSRRLSAIAGQVGNKLDDVFLEMERDFVPPGTFLMPDEVEDDTPAIKLASLVAHDLKARGVEGRANISAATKEYLQELDAEDRLREVDSLVQRYYVEQYNVGPGKAPKEIIKSDNRYDLYMKDARQMMSQVETQMGVLDELIAGDVTDRELLKMKDYQVAAFLLKDIVEKMKDSEGPDGQLAPDSELASEGVDPASYSRVAYAIGELDKKLAAHPGLGDRANTVKQEALGILDEAFDGIDPHSEARRSPIDTEALEAAHMVEARLLMKHRGLLEKMRSWSVNKVEAVVMELLGNVTPERAETIAKNVINDLHNAPGAVLGLVKGQYFDESGRPVRPDGQDRYFRVGGEGSSQFEPSPYGDYVAVVGADGNVADYKFSPLPGGKFFRVTGMGAVQPGAATRGESNIAAPHHLKGIASRLRDTILHQGQLVKGHREYQSQLNAMDEDPAATINPQYMQQFPGAVGPYPSASHFRENLKRMHAPAGISWDGMSEEEAAQAGQHAKKGGLKGKRHSLMPFSVIVHPTHPLLTPGDPTAREKAISEFHNRSVARERKPAGSVPTAPAQPAEVKASVAWVRIAAMLDECGWHDYAEHLDRKFVGGVLGG